ncbi:LysR family transcriptional regulator [Vibrio tapetis]|uniref:Transcriptional regulator, LysR family protein n=1 Tax=Vibrio tapetis subsp. tapetis TaxID=1671868 RepID=A0A2N8ZJK8_9VIBR|nr:LysR family transcriptional regulator [Vibrio tapetis]SON52062.1 Transcriptional regulator, LysR family protein [Vibrio tapetis subsp. tapetis]
MRYQLPLLNIHSLVCFSTIAELGSLQKAATRLGKSKSTMSRWLSELEDTLGYPVFERKSNNLVLEINQQGMALLPKIHSVLASYHRMEGFALGQDANVSPSNLVLSFNQLISNQGIAEQVAHLNTLYPNMDLTILPSNETIESTTFKDTGVDMVLGLEPSYAVPEVGGLVVGEEQMMFTTHPLHPLVGKSSVDINQLVAHTLIAPHFLQQLGYSESIKPVSVTETPDFQLSIELAKQNLGIAYTPEYVARTALKKREVVELSINWEEFSQFMPLMLFFPLDFAYPELKDNLVLSLRDWFGYNN